MNGATAVANMGGGIHMAGGTISGNHAGGANGGGGVANQGTFRISDGVVYGLIATPELRNTGNNAALFTLGTTNSQRGIFSGTAFTSMGNLSSAIDTIRVVNGNLQ